MTRYSNPLNLLAVAALMSGCGGELTPEDSVTLTAGPSEQLATVKQEIASLGYSTYLGFSGDEYGNALAMDGSGNTYITGTTTSFGGTTNIFVAKMSPTGSNIYYTYYAGTQAQGIAVDTSGNAYVVGMTAAGATITKINSTGTAMVYSAALGWNDVSAVKVDSAGNAYVVGSASNGVAGVDVAVGKVDPTGTYFVFSLKFGGTGTDKGKGIAIDTSGNAYIVGDTNSTNFPLVTAFQTTLRGTQDAFVTKVNATGTSLGFSTYLGGNGIDHGNGISVDGNRNTYVTGRTDALNGVMSFPVTSGTAQVTPGGGVSDAYAAKFSSTGGRVYATYLGGGGEETGASIAVTSTGAAYIAGTTSSANFTTTSLAFQRFASAGNNAFVVQLSTTGTYSYSTYLGGNGTDIGSSIAVDSSGNAYVSGNTNSTDFPTNVYAAGGLYDAFVTKFNGP
jgi:hypothetical protein